MEVSKEQRRIVPLPPLATAQMCIDISQADIRIILTFDHLADTTCEVECLATIPGAVELLSLFTSRARFIDGTGIMHGEVVSLLDLVGIVTFSVRVCCKFGLLSVRN